MDITTLCIMRAMVGLMRSLPRVPALLLGRRKTTGWNCSGES